MFEKKQSSSNSYTLKSTKTQCLSSANPLDRKVGLCDYERGRGGVGGEVEVEGGDFGRGVKAG